MKDKLIAAARRCKRGQSWAAYSVIPRKEEAVFALAYDYWELSGSYSVGAEADRWFLLFVAAAAESEGN